MFKRMILSIFVIIALIFVIFTVDPVKEFIFPNKIFLDPAPNGTVNDPNPKEIEYYEGLLGNKKETHPHLTDH